MRISINDVTIEHVSSAKPLGTHLDRHLNWEENVKNTASSCYATLASLKRLNNFLLFHIKKNLAQSLVLSKLFYNDIVYHPLPEYLMKRLQKVQTATASFVLGRYASMEDILKLKWLPVKEHREWGLVRPRPHVSDFVCIRKHLVAVTLSVHTYPVKTPTVTANF